MNSNPPPAVAEKRGGFPLFAAASVWAALVFFRYFFSPSHPLFQALPFLGKLLDVDPLLPGSSARFWETQLGSLRIGLTVFCVSGATWASGARLRQWMGLRLPDSWVRWAFDFGLGVCGLNFFWVGTGLVGLWYPPVWWGTAVLLLGLFGIGLFSLLKKGFRFSFPDSASLIFLGAMGAFYSLFSILQNLAPETFYDSMVYHLAVPAYWLSHHGLADFPTNFFANYPYGAEVYFLNGLAWQGTESAKMLHVVCVGACGLLAGGWAREMAGAKAGWLVLGLVLTFPLLEVNSWSTEVEGFLALAVVLMIYSLNRLVVEKEGPWVWALATGLFAGLALCAKYTAFLAVGGSFFVLLFQKVEFFKRSRPGIWLLLFFGTFLLLSPWILKNLVYTGNPIFPYGMTHFPGRHLPPLGYERLLQEQHARVTTDGWSWLLLPWTLTMANPDSYNFCGPLALAMVPFLFLFRFQHPALRFLAALTPLLLAAGFAVTHILRFVLPVFVLFYVLAGTVLWGSGQPAWGKVGAWAAGFCAVLCFAYMSLISHYYYSCAGIWLGRQTRAEYLMGPGKITPYYDMAQWVNRNLPGDARLLVAGDARGLYYERPFLTNSVFDEQVLSQAAQEEENAEGIARRLKELGVEDVVVNGNEGIRVAADYHHYDLTPGQWAKLDGFIQEYTDLVYQQNLQGVYRILPQPRTAPAGGTLDLILFFSKPASQFVKDVQKHRWKEAEDDLKETLELYPFSAFWKRQKEQFDKAMKQVLGSKI